jgi:putative serine protease PepD
MALGPGTRAVSRLRAPTLLIGGGVVIVALVVVIALLAASGGSGSKAASGPTASPSPSSTSSPSVSDIYQHVGPSVAVVETAKGALGAGVIATATGAVLTANHVVADGSAITIVFADGTRSSATVASADPTTDIAVLTPATLPQPIVPATIGGSAVVGAGVVAIGNPLGFTYSVSAGVVSGLNRTAKTDSGQFSGLIQFDASVNPGSSGGPLLDGKGDVIGIVVSIADPGGADQFAGIAFAVPIGAALGGGGAGTGRGPQI